MKLPKNITPEQIEHIKELSKFVYERENMARENYFKVLDIQSELLEKKVFDIMIDISEKLIVSFDTEEDDTNEITKGFFCVEEQFVSTVLRTREDDEEEPSEVVVVDLENFYSKDEVFHKNYNFFLDKKHPFYGIHFCRGMYSLINKHELSFENLLKINSVWIDFEVEYDFTYFESLLDRLPYTKKKLYLDDLRPAPEGFIWVKNFEEFTSYIAYYRMPGFISFDHDLGEEKSGYDCAKWLVEFCMNREVPLPDFAVHSQNPVGKENIQALLDNFKKHNL